MPVIVSANKANTAPHESLAHTFSRIAQTAHWRRWVLY